MRCNFKPGMPTYGHQDLLEENCKHFKAKTKEEETTVEKLFLAWVKWKFKTNQSRIQARNQKLDQGKIRLAQWPAAVRV